jgi:hypothetical protein
MRQLVLVLIAVLMLLPANVFAGGKPTYRGNRGECRRMTKQINHYENVVLKRARDRGDAMWEASMEEHLSRLKNRRADRCPDYREQRKVLSALAKQAAQMRALMAAAAKGAAKYFTGGWM